MNFFAQQERARSHTRRMLILFVLAVAAIVAAVDIALLVAFGAIRHSSGGNVAFVYAPPAQLLFWPTLLVLAVIGLATAYKVSSLRTGGAAVARQFGARLVDLDDPECKGNFAYRRLHNIVEEIA